MVGIEVSIPGQSLVKVQVLVCVLLDEQVLHSPQVHVSTVHVGVGVQVWVNTGLPPLHPSGNDDTAVRVCWPSAEQVPQSEYVQEVQVGAVKVQFWEVAGIKTPPSQLEILVHVLVCVPFDVHSLQLSQE